MSEKLTAKAIVEAILNNGYTNDELNSIAQSIQHARTNMGMVNKFTMRVGQNVQFTHKGLTHYGEVKKIKQKKMLVMITQSPTLERNVTYDISANMLTPV